MLEKLAQQETTSYRISEKDIVQGYKKFYFFIFRRLPFIVFSLVVIMLIYFFFFKITSSESYVTPMNIKQVKQNYESLNYDSSVFDKHLQVIIKDGYLQQNGNHIVSQGNLALIKGWVLPDVIDIDVSTLPNISEFPSSGSAKYDIENLKKIVKDFVLKKHINEYPNHLQNLVAIKSFIDYFSLSCLNGIKVTNLVCNRYIDIFLNSFFYYDLDTTVDQLLPIYRNLSSIQKDTFCKGLLKYVRYSHSMNMKITKLIRKCGDETIDSYRSYMNFFQAKLNLSNGLLLHRSVFDLYSDLYLLLSFQQSLFSDLQRGHLNTNVIYSYLNLVDTVFLSEKVDSIPHIYYDWVVYFNEHILKPGLEKIRYSSSSSSYQVEVEKVIGEIQKLTNGNPVLGEKGLKDFIINIDILNQHNNYVYTGSEIVIEPLTRITDLVNDLSFFVLVDDYYKNFDRDIIILQGYFIIDNDGKRYNLNSTLEIDVNNFGVRHLTLEKYPIFNNTVNKLLEKNFFSVPDLYQYLSKNIKFYLSRQEISFCDLVREVFGFSSASTFSNVTSYQPSEDISDVYCTPDKVYISRGELQYIIKISGLSVVEIRVNKPNLEKELSSKFLTDTPTEFDLVRLLENIVYYEISDTQNKVYTGSTKVLIVLDKFREYMNLEAKDVVEKGNIILAEILVSGIPFIVHYDFDTDTIKEIFFKDIKLNKDTSLMVPNFNLTLDKSNQKNINLFLIDPLSYIKQKSPNIYFEYLRRTRNKN